MSSAEDMQQWIQTLELSPHPEGGYRPCTLGCGTSGDEKLQHGVPAGSWFGATVNDSEGFSLVGCTVAPGFEFEDFEMASREDLLLCHPEHAWIIERLTR